MLLTLRQIMQQVDRAATLDDALAMAVQQAQKALSLDACAIYLKDPEGDTYVLVASDGETPPMLEPLGGEPGRRLVTVVGQRRELIVELETKVQPADGAPKDLTELAAGSFLGTPLIHYRTLLGVLVARKPAHQPYAADEVTFFLSLGAQLAKLVHEAAAMDGVGRLLRRDARADPYIQAVSAASGLAIGIAVSAEAQTRLESVPDRVAADPVAEEAAFNAAVAAARDELQAAGERLAGTVPEAVRALFEVQVMLLGSDALVSDTVDGIRAGNWAPGAWRTTIAHHAQVFEQMDDPYLRERAADVREIGQHVLMHLESRVRAARGTPQRCILVGETVGLAEIAAVPAPCLAGIVSLHGSPLSHMAVLARALGIPAVVSLAHAPELLDGRELVVDGDEGRVYLESSPALLKDLQKRLDRKRTRSAELQALRALPAQTQDGVQLPLYANIGLPADCAAARISGAEGIGLYRTEYRFLLDEALPVEDEQLRDYRQVLEAFAPMPVTLRTLDVGGDKVLSSFSVQEENPFLGCRGIRFSLDRPELFLIQLRAMLRANAGLGNLQVLFPMIGTVSELDEALHLLARAERELVAEGLEAARPRVGVMIEVPASVFLVGAMARRVDAFSIGTNDLTQYLLAVDRNNVQVVTPYDALHPAVLDAIRQVIDTAHRFGKSVSVCGEMAGDPAGALVLLGLGVDALSMSPPLLGEVKRAIRCLTHERARQLAEAALGMEDGFAIHRLLHRALDRIRACSGST
ncbi:MAG: phosphoenolpyruvate--protein phosphotransferase [Chromatiaceae bacterium]|nr:phosphoenolpyruvate--protein phosphotransferase [Chromatiaceae bacterium]